MVLYISLFGMIISVLFAALSKPNRKSNIYLSAYFFIICLYGLVHYIVLYSGSSFWIAVCFVNLSCIFLLPGPFFYFYVRGVLFGKTKLKPGDYLHFLPAFLHLLGTLPWIFNDFSIKLQLANLVIANPNEIFVNHYFRFFTPPVVNYILRAASGFGYVLYALRLVFKFERNTDFKIDLKLHMSLQWLYIFISMQLLLYVLYFINSCIGLAGTMEGILHARVGLLFYVTEGIVFLLQVLVVSVFPFIMYAMPSFAKKEKKHFTESDQLTAWVDKTAVMKG